MKITYLFLQLAETAIAHATQTEETVKREESIEDLERRAKVELEALSTLCTVKFTCSIISGNGDGEIEPSPKKKPKLNPGHSQKTPLLEAAALSETGDNGTQLCVELKWVEGDDRDILHQILQYLSNRL